MNNKKLSIGKIMITLLTIVLSTVIVKAQEYEKLKIKAKNEKEIKIKLKGDADPDIYVNGKRFEFPLEIIDPNVIESVEVIKNDDAIKKYNSPNGVLLIKTKKKYNSINSLNSEPNSSNTNVHKALIIIDGKKSTSEELAKLSVDDIKTIKILKDDNAIKEYNAPNGVMIISTTKK